VPQRSIRPAGPISDFDTSGAWIIATAFARRAGPRFESGAKPNCGSGGVPGADNEIAVTATPSADNRLRRLVCRRFAIVVPRREVPGSIAEDTFNGILIGPTVGCDLASFPYR
jgi:hypothetical protein